MRCNNCGSEVAEGMKFCPSCGNQMSEPSIEIVETVEVVNGRDETIKDRVEGMASKADLKKYNIGHLGVFLSGILTLAAQFLTNNAGSYVRTDSVVEAINRQGISGVVVAFILFACVLFTMAMAFLKKDIFTIAGSIVSAFVVRFMYATCEVSIFKGMGYLLFVLGGILLIVSSVGAFIINRNARKKNF